MGEEFNRFLSRLGEDLEYVKIGFQEFTSTELYICDPMDQARFPVSAPIVPGRYPIYVVLKDWSYHRKFTPSPHNARFEVWFSDDDPTKWEQLSEGDYQNEFSAEFGCMAFLDNRLMDFLRPINEKGELFDKYLCDQIYRGNNQLPYPKVKLDGNHHLFVVSSGGGNGMYCAFSGHNSTGKLLRISVDFEL